jgi:hypothetical protein
MGRLDTGTLVFLLIATLISAAAHWWVKRYLVACGIAAVAAPVIFLLISALHDKAPTILGPKAWAEFALVSFLLAAVVGVFFLIQRRLLSRGS